MCAAKIIRGENMRDFMKYPGLIRELEALETGFRMDMDINQRRAKIPWIMEGRSGLRQEEDAVWDRWVTTVNPAKVYFEVISESFMAATFRVYSDQEWQNRI